jgi:hypothetical protein
VHTDSGRRGPVGTPSSIAWVIPEAAMALDGVRMQVTVRADLGNPLFEYLRVYVGNREIDRLVMWGHDCAVQSTEIGCDAATFNAAIATDRSVTITFVPSVAVDPNFCPGGSWLSASIDYSGAAKIDCNANGVIDSCEIAAGISPDNNHNGRPDSCDSAFSGCPADLSGDGVVNGADLGLVLSAWGRTGVLLEDLDHDGIVNGADLGLVLSGWGPCPH